ncbi:hypothetical protein QA648_08185 [Rhizobium sp. CB3171]|uniref:hypothetical protein n=1 Tax=Rhizobium sp. CB3171 TaxID=3039157 RepID=UPI0024B11A6D|nr:hypothetical protein [Rhizobium sp. CB3171]WFU04225.1 hypothetical protein QA648_08185 [Rhizobium sp. CB3171]
MSERVLLTVVLAVNAGTPLFRKNTLVRKNTLDEMTVGRTEKPVLGKVPDKPIIRAKPGAGSYEDAVDEKQRKARTKGKTGRGLDVKGLFSFQVAAFSPKRTCRATPCGLIEAGTANSQTASSDVPRTSK